MGNPNLSTLWFFPIFLEVVAMVKPIQELEQVAERLMQQAYQRGRVKSSGSSHRGCVSTLPWLGAKVFYKSGRWWCALKSSGS